MQLLPPTTSLLVALPNGFGFPNMFARRVEKLLSTIEVDHVTVIQDARSIAKSYFSAKNVPVQQVEAFSRVSMKKNLEFFTHIIVFWDGDDLSDLVFTAKVLNRPLRIVPVEITKVRNKDKDEPYDVYIGRGSPWGNPYPIGGGGTGDTRDEVIEKFRAYFEQEFLANPEKHKALLSLRGYRLACHCKPLACHGDVIANYLNSYEGDDESEGD
jgi:hypothetical protein